MLSNIRTEPTEPMLGRSSEHTDRATDNEQIMNKMKRRFERVKKSLIEKENKIFLNEQKLGSKREIIDKNEQEITANIVIQSRTIEGDQNDSGTINECQGSEKLFVSDMFESNNILLQLASPDKSSDKHLTNTEDELDCKHFFNSCRRKLSLQSETEPEHVRVDSDESKIEQRCFEMAEFHIENGLVYATDELINSEGKLPENDHCKHFQQALTPQQNQSYVSDGLNNDFLQEQSSFSTALGVRRRNISDESSSLSLAGNFNVVCNDLNVASSSSLFYASSTDSQHIDDYVAPAFDRWCCDGCKDHLTHIERSLNEVCMQLHCQGQALEEILQSSQAANPDYDTSVSDSVFY